MWSNKTLIKKKKSVLMNIGYRTISYFKNRPRISKLVQTFYFIIIFLILFYILF